MNQELLDEIAFKLRDNASNYSVFLKQYEGPLVETASSITVIRGTFGPQAELGGIDEVVGGVGWQEVEEALFYAGDNGARPSISVLESGQFRALVDQLKAEFFELVRESKKIERFWLRDGHPAYPVFWDFAFLFWRKETAIIFLGSSSD